MIPRALMFGVGLFLFVAGAIGWAEIPATQNAQYLDLGKAILFMIEMIIGGAIAFVLLESLKER